MHEAICYVDLTNKSLHIENDSALDAFSALRRALQFAAVLTIDFSLFRDGRTFALRRGGAGGSHQAFLLALFDVRVPDADDDAVGHDVAQIPVHHLEDEAAVEAEMVFDEPAEEATVLGRLQLVVHLQIMPNEFVHVRWVEEPVDPDHEAENRDDAEEKEEKSHKGEDFVVVQIDGQDAVTRVGQQVAVNLRRAVELAKRPNGKSFGGDELMAEDGRLDQVEAVGEDVRPQEGVHRIQLDEHVRQEHHLHADVEKGEIVAVLRTASATSKQTRGLLLTHLTRDR